MSEVTIFVIGAVIFAITVYGSVMAGGLALTRLEASENAAISDRVVRTTDGSAPPTEPGSTDEVGLR